MIEKTMSANELTKFTGCDVQTSEGIGKLVSVTAGGVMSVEFRYTIMSMSIANENPIPIPTPAMEAYHAHELAAIRKEIEEGHRDPNYTLSDPQRDEDWGDGYSQCYREVLAILDAHMP